MHLIVYVCECMQARTCVYAWMDPSELHPLSPKRVISRDVALLNIFSESWTTDMCLVVPGPHGISYGYPSSLHLCSRHCQIHPLAKGE